MDLTTVTDQMKGLVDGGDSNMPVLTIAAAALATGFVMATVPKVLRPVAGVYVVALAAAFYLHEMQYLYYGIGGGFVAAIVFRTLGFGRAKKA